MATLHVSVREARENLNRLLQKVEQGAKIVITRTGRLSVHLRLIKKTGMESRTLPSLKQWRDVIVVRGGLSETVIEKRNEERY